MRSGRHSFSRMPPHLSVVAATDVAMLEIVFIYQLAQKPLQAMARLWWCRGLFRASRGQRQCPEYSKL
jgi:hypothetical protein